MADEPKFPISDEERQRRKEAADYARASVGLSGFVLSAENEAHAERFINGEIDLAEFVRPRAEHTRG
ncbi:antitoxin VbhA family protein [Pseudomonas sp. W5-01]|uniref:antitoxin VbhA family protein n=1 Tax=Pseudomonas sp. W5-01 TaxID=3097454 RepID=UPI0039789F3E